MPNKIAILLPNLQGGGAERVNLDLASEFRIAGYEIDILLMKAEGDLMDEAMSAFKVTSLKAPRVRDLTWKLTNYLKVTKPEALLVSMWPLTVVSVLSKCLARVPTKLILIEHSILSSQYESWGIFHRSTMRLSMAVAYRLASFCVGVSKGVARDMADLAWLSPNSVKVIYNPIPYKITSGCKSDNRIDELWGSNDRNKLRVLTVGSFKSAKNYPLLLRAFSRLSRRMDVKLMLLGEGKLRPQLLVLSEELGIADQVVMPGFYKNTELFYQSADLFVLSSNREGLPTVLIEALAAGKPVVSTDCNSGPAEILCDGEFGTLVPVNDEVALADAMEQGLNATYDSEKLRARARDFAPKIAARKYLELIK